MNSSTTAQKRLIVVLGMHRSGTSALSRALPIFGIDLGDRLMPPAAGENEKGFWEDLDVYDLNNDLLAAQNAAWDSCGALQPSEAEPYAIARLRNRARCLLEAKMDKRAALGIKDPRFSRLLAFWQPIFRQLDLRVTYILAVRNPVSVARSLQARNGFALSKGYCLWLEHTLEALQGTRGEERLCVDFDEVLLEPMRQLRRIGRVLGREADQTAAREYAAQFLDQHLRHTRFFIGDLEIEPDASPDICELYWLLRIVAITDSAEAWREIDEHLEKSAARLARRQT